MKKRKIIVPLILFLSFYFGQAQLIMIDDETGEYRYEEVAGYLGEEVPWVLQKEQLGTGHAVMSCREKLVSFNGTVAVWVRYVGH